MSGGVTLGKASEWDGCILIPSALSFDGEVNMRNLGRFGGSYSECFRIGSHKSSEVQKARPHSHGGNGNRA